MIDDAALQQARRLQPTAPSAAELRAMSDEQLLDLLSSGGNDQGTLYPAAAHAVSAELLRRQIERSAQPHWSVTPSFWVSAVSAMAALAGLVVGLLALPR